MSTNFLDTQVDALTVAIMKLGDSRVVRDSPTDAQQLLPSSKYTFFLVHSSTLRELFELTMITQQNHGCVSGCGRRFNLLPDLSQGRR